MEVRNTPRIMTVLAGVAVCTIVALVAAGEAHAVARACCLPDGSCEILSRSICEDQQGGVSQQVGTVCADVDCPVLCSGSAPVCNGECPPGDVCVAQRTLGGAMTSGESMTLCSCMNEIPAGGTCDPLADACAPGLACIDGVCAVPVARAPALSPGSLVVLVGVLLALGGAAVQRRRRHR